jgi:hypothetical protein
LLKSFLKIINFKKLKKLGIHGIVVSVVLAFSLFLVILYNSEVGLSNEIGIQEPTFINTDFSAVPQAVIDDAGKMADELVGNNEANHQKVVSELVNSYIAASNADIVIFFNSGGMGWNYIKNTPGWEAILNGITSELIDLGHHPLILNYSRTSRTFWGNIKEFIEASTRYPRKVIGMEKHVEFLVDNLPNLKLIIAGESTGSVLTEQTMDYFRDNPNVFSIQTGCPFWYKTIPQPRTLRLSSNGYGVDTFSYGNIPSMIWSTVKSWFGLSSPQENAGDVLKSLRAPGHDYSWKYDSINFGITEFLDDNFPKKS